MRRLLVDDDSGFRDLLRMTLELSGFDLEEADNAASAADAIHVRRPDVVVLDVRMPGMDGIHFCRALKDDPATSGIAVVLLTGSDVRREDARAAGADAFLAKPFSPLELLAAVERLAGGIAGLPLPAADAPMDEQLLLYARDLRRLLDVERRQRELIQQAYRETVSSLASALESKDTGTGAHSQRVQRYALALADAVDPALADDPGVEYGFLLHDVGKIGIPDEVLRKPGPLSDCERRLMRTHTVLGEQVLGGVAFLRGEGLHVVRSHHERWDGRGYPDRLAGEEIPLGARVFAVADTLDAITSHRPYRRAASWETARAEILAGAGGQFDPDVVAAFREREHDLRRVRRELVAGTSSDAAA